MYHIDGFVYENEPKLIWPSRYIGICADFKKTGFLASYALSPYSKYLKPLQHHVETVLKNLHAPSCYSFHSESWISPKSRHNNNQNSSNNNNQSSSDNNNQNSSDNNQNTEYEIIFCEIASRMGGAGVRHVLREMFGANLDKIQVQFQSQETVTEPHNLSEKWDTRAPDVDFIVGWIFIYPKVGILKRTFYLCCLLSLVTNF